MKSNRLEKIFLTGLFTLIIFITSCGSNPGKSDEEVLNQFIHYINNRSPVFKVHINQENCSVKSRGMGHYNITVKNCSIDTDLHLMIRMLHRELSRNAIPTTKINNMKIAEMVLLYNARDNFAYLKSMKDLAIETKLPESKGENNFDKIWGLEIKGFRTSIARMEFEDLEINTLINPYKNDFTPSTKPRSDDKKKSTGSKIEQLKLEIIGSVNTDENASFVIDVDELGALESQNIDPKYMTYIEHPKAPKPDLQYTLEKGLTIYDMNINFIKVNFSALANGRNIWGGSIQEVLFSQFLKPDDSGKSFKYGYLLELKNFNTQIPGHEYLQLATHINQLNLGFQIKGLNPEIILIYFEFLKKSFKNRERIDNVSDGEIQAVLMKLFSKLVNSKPSIQFSISPLKHLFGEMKLVTDIRLHNLFSGPVLKMTATFFNVKNILRRLKESNLFSPGTLKTISQTIEEEAIMKDERDAVFIYEKDIHQLREMFSNGWKTENKTSGHDSGKQ